MPTASSTNARLKPFLFRLCVPGSIGFGRSAALAWRARSGEEGSALIDGTPSRFPIAAGSEAVEAALSSRVHECRSALATEPLRAFRDPTLRSRPPRRNSPRASTSGTSPLLLVEPQELCCLEVSARFADEFSLLSLDRSKRLRFSMRLDTLATLVSLEAPESFPSMLTLLRAIFHPAAAPFLLVFLRAALDRACAGINCRRRMRSAM